MRALHCVIRDGEEFYMASDLLTPTEAAEIEEQRRSPEARRRFGILLRKARRIADAPYKAAIKLLKEKMARGEPGGLSAEELEAIIADSPEFVKADVRRLHRHRPAALDAKLAPKGK
jgi:hypothetical protein